MSLRNALRLVVIFASLGAGWLVPRFAEPLSSGSPTTSAAHVAPTALSLPVSPSVIATPSTERKQAGTRSASSYVAKQTAEGASLATALDLLPYAGQTNSQARALEAHLESLRQRPLETFEAIRATLEALPPAHFVEEGDFLVDFASRLEVDPALMTGLLENCLKRRMATEYSTSGAGDMTAPLQIIHVINALFTVQEDEEDLRNTLRESLAERPGDRWLHAFVRAKYQATFDEAL